MLPTRFATKLNLLPSGCWLWTAGRNGNGYGYYRPGEGKSHVRVHRFAYEQLVGPIPEGLHLHHRCGNRTCVNPAHLQPVTPGEHLMLGDTFQRRNTEKVCCPQGHPYNEINTGRTRGRRWCRTCKREKGRATRLAREVREAEGEGKGKLEGTGAS